MWLEERITSGDEAIKGIWVESCDESGFRLGGETRFVHGHNREKGDDMRVFPSKWVGRYSGGGSGYGQRGSTRVGLGVGRI